MSVRSHLFSPAATLLLTCFSLFRPLIWTKKVKIQCFCLCFFKNNLFLLIFWAIVYKTSLRFMPCATWVSFFVQRRRASTSHIPNSNTVPAVHDGGKPPCCYDSFMYNNAIVAFVFETRYFFIPYRLNLREPFCTWGCNFVSSRPEFL